MGVAGNMINWLIGYVIMLIWFQVGNLLSLFGMWQVPLDGITGVVDSFKFPNIGDVYLGDMSYAV